MENTKTQQEFLSQFTLEAIAEDMIINLICNGDSLAKDSLKYLYNKDKENSDKK